jgi:metal-responsive CopG/Arc/MetJ family transcriptional regulator
MKDKGNISKSTVRSSISFSQTVYTSLEEIALEKRVSLAWVVRDAVETYLKGQKEGKNVKQA